jgi:hypothetical protein
MALPTIQGVVRAAVTGAVAGGGKWVNVWHARYAGGASIPGTAEIDLLHPHLVRIYTGTAYGAGLSWLNSCPTSTTITGIDYTILDNTSLGYSKTASGAGLQGGSSLPGEVAHVLTLRTAVRGRRYRGRVFLPTAGTTATVLQANGNLTTTSATGIEEQVKGAMAALTAVQWKLGVASYGKSLINDPNDPHDKIPVTWAPFFTELAVPTMNLVADVIRRRKS